jgi:hypothetical protein
MEIRNGTYTIFEGKQFELSIDKNEDFVLYSFGETCSGVSFQKVPGRPYLLEGIVNKTRIINAFSVSTYAKYKCYVFQVDKFENGKFRLSTTDSLAFEKLGLNMVDRGWYDIWVLPSELNSAWEERRESGLNLPFPDNIERIKEVQLGLF